jgi:predicted DNA-binding transcriptional regulator AlpA
MLERFRAMTDRLSTLLQGLRLMPAGTMLPAATLAEMLEPIAAQEAPTPAPEPTGRTWREKLWTVPADTRMGVVEVAEAIGRPKSWVYRRTAPGTAKARLPHRRLDGELVFTAGEIRAWLQGHEAIVVEPVVSPIGPHLKRGNAA